MKKYIAGVDLGSESISVSLGEQDENADISFKFINTYQSRGIKKGRIVDVNEVSESLKNITTDINNNFNDEIKWYVGISNNSVNFKEFSSRLEIKNGYNIITEAEISCAVKKAIDNFKQENETVICYDIQDYIVDGINRKDMPIGVSAKNIIVNGIYFFIKRDYYYNIKNSLNLSGIERFEVYLTSYELKNIIMNENNAKKNILLVDIGAQCTNYFNFYDGNLISMGFVPLGGRTISNDLSICAELEKDEAEKVKLLYSNIYRKKYKEQLIGIPNESEITFNMKLYNDVVQARIEEMFSLIKESLSIEKFSDIQRMYVIGNGIVEFENINSFIEDKFKKKTILLTKDELKIRNYSTINSICLVKSAFDRLKWNSEENEKLNDNKICTENDTDLREKESNNKGILSKFKKLLDDIF